MTDNINTTNGFEPRKRAHSSPLAAGLASELKTDFHPYGEDSPRLAAGRVQSRMVEFASTCYDKSV